MGEHQTHGRILCGQSNRDLCPKFGVLISIFSKEDIAYRVTIGSIPLYTCPNFIKNIMSVIGKERDISVKQTSLLCVQILVQGGLQ